VEYRQDELVWKSLNSVLAATQLLPEIVEQYISHKSLSTAVLEKQETEAQARLRQVALRSERGSVDSPIDGVVLAKYVDDAQFASAGAMLLQIGRMSDLEVEADVLSQDATRIHPGAVAEMYALTTGGELGAGISGTVRRVYPRAFTKISSLGVEQQRVKVIIGFTDAAMDTLEQFQVGADYRVRVRIFTKQERDALIIPQSALFRSGDGLWQVFAVRDGRVRLQEVTVGLINDEQVQVSGGLDDEEEVILAPGNDIQDGIRVKAAT
jgi:HlyD family secretion protein